MKLLTTRKSAPLSLLLLATVLAAGIGCRKNRAETPSIAPRALTAISSAVTIEHLRHLPLAGGALLVLGVAAGALGKAGSGLVLAVGGAGAIGVYVAASEYPWALAALTLALCGVGCAMAILWMLERRKRLATADALKETVAVIQPHHDLKNAMCDGDTERQDRLRPVIDPVKQQLRAEGRL